MISNEASCLVRIAATVICIFAMAVGVTAAAPSKPFYISDFYCDQGPLALRIGRSLHNLRALGVMREEQVEEVKPDGTETRLLRFDGLLVRAVFPPRDYSNGLIAEVIISKPQWDLASGLKVGTSLSTLSRKINRTVTPEGPEVRLCGDADCVTLTLERDRVQGIQYACYTG